MVSKGNKDYLESWNRAHSFYVLINNLFTCFLRPETLQETEFKGDRLIWRKKKHLDSIYLGCGMVTGGCFKLDL